MSNSEKMLQALEQQKLQEADRYFQQALEQDAPEILVQLADYLEGIGFFPQAQEIYRNLLEIYPEVGLNLARIANEDGQIEEAFAYLEEIAPDSPYYVDVLLVKADLYQSEGLADVAHEKLQEASLLSDDPIIVFGLAEVEMELGHFQAAIRHYAQLDNRDIYQLTKVSTYQRIGSAYASLGKFEAAIEFLEKAVELEYEEQTLFELAVLLFEQEEYQKALLYFKQLDALNPQFDGYEWGYAQALHAEHKIAEALAMVQKGLAKNEFDVTLMLAASQYSYEMHDKEAAEAYLRQAQAYAEDQNEILLRLTTLYLEDQRFEEVVALDEDQIDNVLARWNIAKAYQQLEKEEEALQGFEQLKDDLGDNPEFLLDYIESLRRKGAVEEARYYAGRYLTLVPDDMTLQEFYQMDEEDGCQ